MVVGVFNIGGKVFLGCCLMFLGMYEVFDLVKVNCVDIDILGWYWFVLEKFESFELYIEYLLWFMFYS